MAAIGRSLYLNSVFRDLDGRLQQRAVPPRTGKPPATDGGAQIPNICVMLGLSTTDLLYYPAPVVGPYAKGDAQGVGDNVIEQLRSNIRREGNNALYETRAPSPLRRLRNLPLGAQAELCRLVPLSRSCIGLIALL